MRVLLTTDTIGGVWTYTRELTEGLLERAHSISLVSFGRPPSPDQLTWCSRMSARYPNAFLYQPTHIPLEWMEANESAYAAAEPLILDLAQTFGADLLHSNQFCFGKLPLALPKLVVAHSDVLSWAAACHPRGLDPSPWLGRYKDHVEAGLSHASAVAAPTHWMLDALSRNFPLPGQAYVILNGRDIPPAPSILPRNLQAITAGRLWDPAKGLSLLNDVQSPIPMLIAGEIRRETTTAAPPLGGTTLLGHIDDQSLINLLRSSSIYLALSIYEPFGLAPLEAALCGCAILANDLPSLREVWGSAALFFNDAGSLSALLSRLASDPILLRNAQRRALDRACYLTRSRMVEQYLDLYHHLLDLALPLHPAPTEVPVHV